jgi:aquaporin Z
MLERDYLRRGVAEFVGTFALVFVAAGATIYGNVTPLGSALAYGFVVATMMAAVGLVSGGHFNPAVTLAFLVTRRISPVLAVWYWLVQLGAGTLAALLLKWVLPNSIEAQTGIGAPSLYSAMNSGTGVVIEAVLTFFVVWVFFATAVDPRGTLRQLAGPAVGLTVTAGVLMSAGLTGGMLNPARAFGPQLVGNHWSHFWIWYVGPLAGGVIAAALYELLYLRPSAPAAEPEPAPDETPVY